MPNHPNPVTPSTDMTDQYAEGQAEFEAVTTLTSHQMKRVLHAVWFTPGRSRSSAVNDAISDRLVAEADAGFPARHEERYGNPPTEDELYYRAIASQVDWGWPVICIGPPGTAKTSIGEGISAKNGLLPHTIVASQQRPEDVGGFPVPDDGVIRKLPAPWVDVVCGAPDGAVWISDEITTADEDMEAAMLRVFSDGAAGDRLITGRVRMVAFGNSPGEVARARDLTPASANRFMHLSWRGPTKAEWSAWVSRDMDRGLLDALARRDPVIRAESGIDPNREEMRVLKAWPAALAKAKLLVNGFMSTRAAHVHNMPSPGHPDQSKAWPSHRSNEVAIRAWASCIVHNLDGVERLAMLSGLIGVEQTNAMVAYISSMDLPDAMKVLDDLPQDVRVLDGEDADGNEVYRTVKGSPWRPGDRLDVTVLTMLETAEILREHPHMTCDDPELWVKRATHWWELAIAVDKAGHTEAIFRPAGFVIRAGYGHRVCPAVRALTAEISEFMNAVASR